MQGYFIKTKLHGIIFLIVNKSMNKSYILVGRHWIYEKCFWLSKLNSDKTILKTYTSSSVHLLSNAFGLFLFEVLMLPVTRSN